MTEAESTTAKGSRGRRRLLVALALFVIAAIAWSASSAGTRVCQRCGLVSDVEFVGPLAWHQRQHANDATEWFESVCGACDGHAWRRTGCWFERGLLGGRVSCTELQDRNVFVDLCADLSDRELAQDVARHFAALSPSQRGELFRRADTELRAAAERDAKRFTADLRVWATAPVSAPLVLTR